MRDGADSGWIGELAELGYCLDNPEEKLIRATPRLIAVLAHEDRELEIELFPAQDGMGEQTFVALV